MKLGPVSQAMMLTPVLAVGGIPPANADQVKANAHNTAMQALNGGSNGWSANISGNNHGAGLLLTRTLDPNTKVGGSIAVGNNKAGARVTSWMVGAQTGLENGAVVGGMAGVIHEGDKNLGSFTWQSTTKNGPLTTNTTTHTKYTYNGGDMTVVGGNVAFPVGSSGTVGAYASVEMGKNGKTHLGNTGLGYKYRTNWGGVNTGVGYNRGMGPTATLGVMADMGKKVQLTLGANIPLNGGKPPMIGGGLTYHWDAPAGGSSQYNNGGWGNNIVNQYNVPDGANRGDVRVIKNTHTTSYMNGPGVTTPEKPEGIPPNDTNNSSGNNSASENITNTEDTKNTAKGTGVTTPEKPEGHPPQVTAKGTGVTVVKDEARFENGKGVTTAELSEATSDMYTIPEFPKELDAAEKSGVNGASKVTIKYPSLPNGIEMEIVPTESMFDTREQLGKAIGIDIDKGKQEIHLTVNKDDFGWQLVKFEIRFRGPNGETIETREIEVNGMARAGRGKGKAYFDLSRQGK